jgi:hypothetical protein
MDMKDFLGLIRKELIYGSYLELYKLIWLVYNQSWHHFECKTYKVFDMSLSVSQGRSLNTMSGVNLTNSLSKSVNIAKSIVHLVEF